MLVQIGTMLWTGPRCHTSSVCVSLWKTGSDDDYSCYFEHTITAPVQDKLMFMRSIAVSTSAMQAPEGKCSVCSRTSYSELRFQRFLNKETL